MKTIKQFFIFLFAILLVLPCLHSKYALVGRTSASAMSYPLELTDGYGRNVSFAAEPSTVVSLAPSATEIIFATGAGDKVIAVDPFSNYPLEDTADLLKISNFPSIDIESIISLDPNVVFGAGLTSQDDIATLENNGVTVFILAPLSLGDVLDDITAVGQITNHVENATTLRASLQDRIAAVMESTASFTSKPKVFLENMEWKGYSTYGVGTFGHDLIELAGGINIAENASGLYPSINDEFIITQNPDIIFYTNGTWTTKNETVISQRTGWNVITAVKEGRIYAINEDWTSRGGARLIDALEEIHGRLSEITSSGPADQDLIPGFEWPWILSLTPVAAVTVLKRRSFSS